MKKIHLTIEIILLAAVAVLYFIVLSNKKCQTASAPAAGDSTAVCTKLPVAYINVDTLLLQYEYSQELNEQLMRKRENSQANYNQKARQLQQEATEFQRKLENNAFLSEQRARSEQERLLKKEKELQELDQRLSAELATEMQRMNERLHDSIYSYLKAYNRQAGYQLIFSNSNNDNIMVGATAYDITQDIVEGLNRRYNAKTRK
ncbi:MAG: OmpH family outer membrane protein [Bacteroidales bacterium]|nr:OmpH family outer membrane protein [Bacteroidales bacterium]